MTDEERREVAQRFRGIDHDSLKESLICAFLDAVGEPGYLNWVEIAHRLADLIEPLPERTCENVACSPCAFRCGNCGWFDKNRCDFNFCPNCGAKVVE